MKRSEQLKPKEANASATAASLPIIFFKDGEQRSPLDITYSHHDNDRNTCIASNKCSRIKNAICCLYRTAPLRHSYSSFFVSFAVLFSLSIFVSILWMIRQYDYMMRRQYPGVQWLKQHAHHQQQLEFSPRSNTSSFKSTLLYEKEIHNSTSHQNMIHHENRVKDSDEKGEILSRDDHTEQFSSNPYQRINAISILGERNSGTTWLYE
jgi:hypothetical protein